MSTAYRVDGTTIYRTDTGMPFAVAFHEADAQFILAALNAEPTADNVVQTGHTRRAGGVVQSVVGSVGGTVIQAGGDIRGGVNFR